MFKTKGTGVKQEKQSTSISFRGTPNDVERIKAMASIHALKTGMKFEGYGDFVRFLVDKYAEDNGLDVFFADEGVSSTAQKAHP